MSPIERTAGGPKARADLAPGVPYRTGRVQVLAILMIIFSGLGLLESGAQVLAAATERPRPAHSAQQSLLDLVAQGDPRLPAARRRVRYVAGLSGIAVGVLHLAAGLTLLTGSRASELLRIAFSALAPARAIVVVVLAWAWLGPLRDGGLLQGQAPAILAQITGLSALSAGWAILCAVLSRGRWRRPDR